jgi:hypothetical protein
MVVKRYRPLLTTTPAPTEPTKKRRFYSRAEVAAMFGVDASFIRRLELEGRLKAVRLTRSPSSKVFFEAGAVDAFVQEVVDG